jgi:hypothetical protein
MTHQHARLKARMIRKIRRRCQKHSQCRDHCGVSELFLAPARDAEVILAVHDLRLKCWLLGFQEVFTTPFLQRPVPAENR